MIYFGFIPKCLFVFSSWDSKLTEFLFAFHICVPCNRLSKAHVLVCGLNGTTTEFCKNIVLAGVGSLSLMDDHMVTEDDLNANFLIPPDESIYGGRSLAEVCCESLKDFNPMVRVSVEKGDPSLIDGEFLDKFDIIVVSGASLKTNLFINENCRKRSKRIAFYAIDCKDSCGEIFVDLQKHSYVQKKPAGETEQQELTYPSLQVHDLGLE
ncbi:SUMO-activating enzyme subunit 1A-like isoform X1 [Panicum virgatum]|uniref:SUMO-activating enzyme subunit 1A-like isoform X1 n=1 Tax=Panicum virgatum TaxID=38727 RepID=UPI0019D5DC16|nr:SUMO-activating enzyme subunit 1A-like isoform X1 [Panicum virgatum]